MPLLNLQSYRCLHSTAPLYLADELCKVADINSRRRLRSASTLTLVVPPMRHSDIGDRAFPVAASRVWNSLPSSVTSSTSLAAFRRRLKAELFSRCFGPDCVWRFLCSARFTVLFDFENVLLISFYFLFFFIVKCSCSPSDFMTL